MAHFQQEKRTPKDRFEDVRMGKPALFIGKNLITPGVVKHVKELFKQQSILKLKFQKNIVSKERYPEIILELCDKTKSYCLDLRGHVFILSRYQIEGVHWPKQFQATTWNKD